MGLFGGKSFKNKDTWSSGGNKHVRRNFTNGSSQVNTYRGSKLVSIRDTDRQGHSHNHKVARNIFGPYKGSRI